MIIIGCDFHSRFQQPGLAEKFIAWLLRSAGQLEEEYDAAR